MFDKLENKNIKPLVTVVIPYYNDGAYIEETVESMLNQTYKNIEIIIVNDGSTDDFSIQKLNIFNNSKIKIIHQKNTGLSAARNSGFKKAISEYILTIDSDDLFENTFVEKAIEILIKNDDTGAVSAWAEGFGVRKFLWKLTGGKIEDFVYGNQCVACALIRKSVWTKIGGYREELKNGYEDWDFWLRVTDLGYEVYVIPEPLFLYRQKNTSMLIETQKKHSKVYEEILTLNKNIFEKYFIELLVDKEKKNYQQAEQIAQKNQQLNTLRTSREFILGNRLISPLKRIINVFRKRVQ